MKTRASNRHVGDLIGLTPSGVSRIRSGARSPSLATMRKVQALTGWSLEEQATALESGSYAVDFENIDWGDHGCDA